MLTTHHFQLPTDHFQNQDTQGCITLNITALNSERAVKFRGILIDNRLFFNEHIHF